MTRPLEDAISSLGGIKSMQSSSQVSLSQIIIEFEEGVNVDVAASDVQQKVSGTRRELPSEVEEPSYSIDFNDIPIVNLAVTSVGEPDRCGCTGWRTTSSAALEGIAGVGRVTVVAGPRSRSRSSRTRLRAYGLTIADVTGAVQSQYPRDLRRPDEEWQRGVHAEHVAAAGGAGDLTSEVSRAIPIPTPRPGDRAAQRRQRLPGRRSGHDPAPERRGGGLLVFKQSSANITQTATRPGSRRSTPSCRRASRWSW